MDSRLRICVMRGPLAAILVAGCGIDEAVPASQAADSIALGVALTHARTMIPEGGIQVSSDSVAAEAEAVIEAAARLADFSFGPDDEAVRCEPWGACEPIGGFLGMIHVIEVRRTYPDVMIVTLRMYHFTPEEVSKVSERIEDVHLVRAGPDADWEIVRVVLISET